MMLRAAENVSFLHLKSAYGLYLHGSTLVFATCPDRSFHPVTLPYRQHTQRSAVQDTVLLQAATEEVFLF
jgi:hypothetical protein